MHAVAPPLQPVEEAAHAVPAPLVVLPLAVDHPAAVGSRQLLPRHVDRRAAPAREADQVVLALGVALALPHTHGAFGQRAAPVRDHQVVVDGDDAPEAAAALAGADRGIEGEQAGERLPVGDVARRAVQLRGEPARAGGAAVRVHRPHRDPSVAMLQGGLQVLDDARQVARGQRHPVLDHLQPPRPRLRGALLGVDAVVAPGRQQGAHLLQREVGRHRHLEGDQHELPVRSQAQHLGGDGLRCVHLHGAGAAAAGEPGRAREQELQVVVELGHGADRGARVPHRVGLIDGDGRRHPLHRIHRRAVHPVQELPRIGGEGLHVAPLALGVNRVEGQRRLAGARHAGDHGHARQRDLDVKVAEVVGARAADDDRVVPHDARVVAYDARVVGHSDCSRSCSFA